MRQISLPAIIFACFALPPVELSAVGCNGLDLEQCRDRISDIESAVVWMEAKRKEDSDLTEVTYQACKEGLPARAELNSVLSCMLDTLGP
jgi:hypothetical protein